jgi:large subunit ribosomal protein L17
MRHLKQGRKLNRTASHRKALFRNLANALLSHESIKTTNPKAMELRRVAERLITMAKENTLHSMRLAFAYLRDKETVRKLFTDIGARYANVSGGYTRVIKIGPRRGDAAPMAIIELTHKVEKEEKKEKKAPKADKKEAKAEKKAKAAKKEAKASKKEAAAEKKEGGEEKKRTRSRKKAVEGEKE